MLGCSVGVPPPGRHPWVQACRPSPGRFRARLARVRGRQGPSFIAEDSVLSLVENKKESGLFHWAVTPAPAFEAQGPGGTLGWSYDGGRAQRVIQISQYWGVDGEPS